MHASALSGHVQLLLPEWGRVRLEDSVRRDFNAGVVEGNVAQGRILGIRAEHHVYAFAIEL